MQSISCYWNCLFTKNYLSLFWFVTYDFYFFFLSKVSRFRIVSLETEEVYEVKDEIYEDEGDKIDETKETTVKENETESTVKVDETESTVKVEETELTVKVDETTEELPKETTGM